MSKKNQGEQKASVEKTVKTGSEKKEPAKALNQPLYDIETRDNNETNTASEGSLNDVDFPPEFAETLDGIHEQLGLAPDEPIPDGVLNKFYEKLLDGIDIEKLVHELKCEKVFGIPEDDDGKKFETAGNEEDSFEDFEDNESNSNCKFTDCDMDEFGNTLVSTIDLVAPEGTTGKVRFIFPLAVDDEGVKPHRPVVHVLVPFFEMVPGKELTADSKYASMSPKPRFITPDGEDFYLVSEETYNSFLDAARDCGVAGPDDPAVEVDDASDFKSMVKALSANGMIIKGADCRKDGYYEDLMEYWYNGKTYHEKDVIWFELPHNKTAYGVSVFSANMDNFVGFYSPIDVSKAKNIEVKNFRRVLSKEEEFEIKARGQNVEFYERLLPAEEVWYLAKEHAKTENTVGYCIVCLDGKFYVPVEGFINFRTFENEELIVPFNVVECYSSHHKCVACIVADIGNMRMRTSVRYVKGHEFCWKKRIDNEIESRKVYNPDYDPYADPSENVDFYPGDE